MENSFRDEKNIFNLQVDEVSKSYLLETAKWGKFLAVLSLIVMGLVLLLFVFAGAAMTSMSSAYGNNSGMAALGATGMIMMMLIAFAIYFYPIYALIKFANLIKPAIHTGNQQQFNEALGYLKGMFKYIGILTIIVLCLYALVFIFAIIGGAMS